MQLAEVIQPTVNHRIATPVSTTPVNQKNNPNMGQSLKRGWRLPHPITGRSFKAYSSLWTHSQVTEINAG